MNTQRIELLAKLARHAGLISFSEWEGKLITNGIFSVEPWEKKDLAAFAKRISDAIAPAMKSIMEAIQQEIRDEIAKG